MNLTRVRWIQHRRGRRLKECEPRGVLLLFSELVRTGPAVPEIHCQMRQLCPDLSAFC